jgi:hypothetical protein
MSTVENRVNHLLDEGYEILQLDSSFTDVTVFMLLKENKPKKIGK